MKTVQITVGLVANAGIMLSMGNARILIDALHTGESGFSGVPQDMLNKILRCGREPDMVLATHRHGDHFSYELWKEARLYWKNVLLASPEECVENTVTLQGDSVELSRAGVRVEARRTVHEGQFFSEVPHYSFFIECSGCRILFSGDMKIDCRLAALAGEKPVNLAIMPFPWYTLPKARAALKRELSPECLLLCHIPFKEDDVFNYRKEIARLLELENQDVRALLNKGQTERYTFDTTLYN